MVNKYKHQNMAMIVLVSFDFHSRSPHDYIKDLGTVSGNSWKLPGSSAEV